MQRRIHLAATLAACAVLSSVACGRSTHQSTVVSETSPNAPVSVQVTNHNPQDVDVFAVDGDQRWRLGTVTTSQTATFQLPSTAARAGSDLRLVVHPIGGGGEYTTGRVTVSPGDEVELQVAAAIPQTSFRIGPR
jgi:hypothetical protein